MSEKNETHETTASTGSPPGSPKGEAAHASSFSDNEPVPHLHLKTYLAVFTVCLIYYAQLFNIVGAGAVSFPCPL